MKPSTPRGLPAPRSNAAARSRNTQQYTQRLSIQNEGGFRFTGRCRRVRESSFLWTCHWGGCSKMVLTFRGYVIGQSLCLACSHPFFERRKQEGQSRVLSPSLVFCRLKAWISKRLSAVKAAPGRRSQSMRRTIRLPNADGGDPDAFGLAILRLDFFQK